MVLFKETKQGTVAFYVTDPEINLKTINRAKSYATYEEAQKQEIPSEPVEGYDLLTVQRDHNDTHVNYTMIYCKQGAYKQVKVMRVSAYK